MTDLKLTPALREMLERIERGSGRIMMISVVGSGRSEDRKLGRLRAAGYVVKCDSADVRDPRFGTPAEALAITDAGRAALAAQPAKRRTKQ
jgi:hypothetical protein